MTSNKRVKGKDEDKGVIPRHSPKLGTNQGDANTMMNYSFGGDGESLIGVRKFSSILRSLLFSSRRTSTSFRKARYFSQNSSVTRMASSAAGKRLRSRTGGTGPYILWEKARPVLIDPTKVGLPVLDPAAIYPSLFDDVSFIPSIHPARVSLSRPRRSSHVRRSSQPSEDEPWEDIWIEIARNENTTRKRYTDLGGSGGLYIKKFYDKRKGTRRTRVGKELRGDLTIPRRGLGLARA